MAITLFCNAVDSAGLEWFTNVLLSRMVKPLPVDLDIVYGVPDAPIAAHDGHHVTVRITKQPRTMEVAEKAIDSLGRHDWMIHQDREIILNTDIVGFSLWMLNREEEALQKHDPDCWDKWGRFRLEKTLAYRKGVWRKPVFDILCKELIERIERLTGTMLLDRAPWGQRAKAVWLTHDVDKLCGKYALPLRVLGWLALAARDLSRGNMAGCLQWVRKCRVWIVSDGDPTFESIGMLMDRNASMDARSTFFFMSLPRGVSFREGIRYPVGHRSIPKVAEEIEARGSTIGLHPGLYGAHDARSLLLQKAALERVLNRDVVLVRNHYLRVRYPDAWEMEENAGFRLSSNTGWPSQDGFRAGTCWPYHPFDLQNDRPFTIIEVPLVFMDSRTVNGQAMLQDALALADEVASVHGVLTLNFHSTVFDHYENAHKLYAYDRLLDALDPQEWHFLDASEVLCAGYA